MANTAWRSVTARCPHYARSNARCITCAITEDGARELRNKLETPQDCDRYFREHCMRRYQSCIFYMLINGLQGGDK